jgi:hypothetical protein
MWPHVIVMAPPDFDQDASFGTAAEPFHAQAFVELPSSTRPRRSSPPRRRFGSMSAASTNAI